MAEVDVLVIGGGPAGVGAAAGAARAGARTVLTERYGFLGGNATAALVMPLMSFHTQRHRPAELGGRRLLPTDHGPGDPVIAGVLSELIDRLVKMDGAIPPSEETGYVVPFDPETLKGVALDLLDEAGVELLFHVFASEVLKDGDKVHGVVVESKSGPLALRADAVVDCTGDADIAARGGARHVIGREGDAAVQPMTLMFRMVGFDAGRFQTYVKAHPAEWRGVHGLWDLVRQATERGELDLPREDVLFFETPHEGEIAVNSTRVTQVLGVDALDLTHAEWEGRRQMRQIAEFLRRSVPGFEKSYVVQSGVQVGVRETRRIVGDYVLTADDVLSARKFDDVVARCSYPIDIHNPAGRGTTLVRLPEGDAYDIPLRALVPQGVEGVIVAGRAISGTHEAHSSYRVMPTAMATGHAAGVAAAVAARTQRPLRALSVGEVQAELRRQGANLGPPR